MVTLDTKKLDEVMNTYPIASDVFTLLSSSKNIKKLTNFKTLKAKLEKSTGPIPDYEWKGFIKGLEATHAGMSLKHDMFKWHFNLTHIAKMALNEEDFTNKPAKAFSVNELFIREMVKSNAVAYSIFKELSQRERYRKVTDLRRLFYEMRNKKCFGPETDIQAFMDVFKMFDKDAKLGSFIIGRNNHPHRFQWNYNLKDLARMALGENVTPQSLKPDLTNSLSQSVQIPNITPIAQKIDAPINKNDSSDYVELKVLVPANVPYKDILAYIEMGKNLGK